jgi:pyruvate/2-oxoglutarate dehydrogenase complex dihydrolipoamide acyltransferase (E2) component
LIEDGVRDCPNTKKCTFWGEFMSELRATPDDDELVAFTSVRRIIAQRMRDSKATSPHALIAREVDYEAVKQARDASGEQFRQREGFGLSYLAFSACATVAALKDFPQLNASVQGDALVVHRRINLGIAVDLPQGGLVVPVVHDAAALTLTDMARRIRDLAQRARSQKLMMADITGGTFTITNTGPFGTLLTGAIINQPEVAILATDGIVRRPVVVSHDGVESIAIRSIGLASVNFDHRAVDGAYVARFLARLDAVLQERDWIGDL